MDFISDVEKKMGDMLGGSAMLCQKGDETPHEVLYFPITALGEPIRLALAVGGFPFTDTNPRNCETFQERKKELSPLGEAGQVPILVLPNGKTMCQCRAILRYLGKVCKFEGTPLYPTDPIAAYEADALIELCEDMRSPLGATFAISDQAEKEAARAALWAEGGKQKKWAAVLDEQLSKDPMTTLTIGNIYAFCIVNMFRTPTFLDGVPPGVFDEYPAIQKHHDWVANLAPVLEYYKEKDGIRVAFQPLPKPEPEPAVPFALEASQIVRQEGKIKQLEEVGAPDGAIDAAKDILKAMKDKYKEVHGKEYVAEPEAEAPAPAA